MSEKENADDSIEQQLDKIIENSKDGASAMKKIIDAISKERNNSKPKSKKN